MTFMQGRGDRSASWGCEVEMEPGCDADLDRETSGCNDAVLYVDFVSFGDYSGEQVSFDVRGSDWSFGEAGWASSGCE
jgi:hypothetical protein